MFCLPATKRYAFLTTCLEARCALTVLGHLGAPHRNGAVGGELSPDPWPFSFHPQLHPAFPGALHTHVDTSAHKSQLWLSPSPKMVAPWLSFRFRSIARVQPALERMDPNEFGKFDRHLLGPRLWSRWRSIGSGWSLLFGPWGERSFKVRGPRQPSYPATPQDLSVVLASVWDPWLK